MKNLFKIIILTIFFMGCSVFNYHKEFIDVEKTTSLEIGMSLSDVENRLGRPHYVEFTKTSNDSEEYRYFYNTKEKVYNHEFVPMTKFPISKNVNFIYPFGFSTESNKLILYFTDRRLTKIELVEGTN